MDHRKSIKFFWYIIWVILSTSYSFLLQDITSFYFFHNQEQISLCIHLFVLPSQYVVHGRMNRAIRFLHSVTRWQKRLRFPQVLFDLGAPK